MTKPTVAELLKRVEALEAALVEALEATHKHVADIAPVVIAAVVKELESKAITPRPTKLTDDGYATYMASVRAEAMKTGKSVVTLSRSAWLAQQ
jgi:hypothetical protein